MSNVIAIINELGEYISALSNSAAYEGKKLVLLIVPAAKSIPISYAGERYIRIGSSKEIWVIKWGLLNMWVPIKLVIGTYCDKNTK